MQLDLIYSICILTGELIYVMIADICRFILPSYLLFVFIELAHSFYVFCWIVFLMFSSASMKVIFLFFWCSSSVFLLEV